MNKLKMESVDMTQKNIDVIAKLFPQVVTEVADPSGAVDENGKPLLRKAIDFEKLKLVLSAGTGDYVVADDERERYEFTWVGKRQAMIDAATPIRKTLRPCPDESKNWASTENMYIEGDNLEVLKLLQESYLGKVKMIYIDPPYNTGNDFIYKDNFTQSREEYEEELDMFDEEGNRLFQNTETNGRFHSDWCSMIYPRLQLARNLLTDDGVIFISIDDNEVRNLKNICDEVFGEANFVNTITWEKRYSPQNAVQWFSESHDFILVYAKFKDSWLPNLLERSDEMNARYRNLDNDTRGDWKPTDATAQGGHGTASQFYELVAPSGQIFSPPTGRCWVYTKERMEEMIADNRVWFGNEGKSVPAIKRFLTDVKQGVACQTIWKYEDVGHNQEGKKEIKALFPEAVPFDTPKPTRLIDRILNLSTSFSDNDIILDFFSGSATTAHAVMQLNAEDGGNRKFIMVQLPEVCDDKSEAAKAKFKTICEIGKERIRRAGAKIEGEREFVKIKSKMNEGLFGIEAKKQPKLDTGFRVFKLDTTNMKDVYYAAGQLSQSDLFDTVSNIKDDRTDIDLLYGCLLDWGVQLTMPHTTQTIDGFTVHTVDTPLTPEVDLIACFESNISETVVRTIAAQKPTRALFRDSSFADSANKINVVEIFKSISPDTTVKVI